MNYLVYGSGQDPGYFVVTDQAHLDQTLAAYRASNPGDQLSPVLGARAHDVLESLPEPDIVASFIDLIGYYGYSRGA